MFTCLWKVWDWLDPTVMDNKKYYNQSTSNDLHGTTITGPLIKHKPHTVPHNLNLMQYGVSQHQHHHYPTTPDAWQCYANNQQSQQQHQQQQHQQQQRQFNDKEPQPHFGPQQILSKTFEYIDGKRRTTTNNVSSGQQLRSPAPKRSSESVTAMKGWLHKQGSDGLKVWRKRWFVLAEYCLYYYKGPEEEKVLGSILLPSYKVSVCGAEDKMYKKFCFKCEHANMRTYYLAADSQEIMMDWIRALNVACTLQTNVLSESNRQLGSGTLSDNNDSGFYNYHYPQQQQHQQPSRPFDNSIDLHSCSNTSGNPSSPSYSFELNNCPQPLYVNAPPKPRRLTDTSYSSQSPETIPDTMKVLHHHHQYQHYHPQTKQQMQQPSSIYGYTKPPVRNVSTLDSSSSYIPPPIQIVPQMRDNVERRTPDTYGRSKLNADKIKNVSDYEDLYSDEALYRRPLSPVAYSNIKKISSVSSVNAQYPYNPIYGPLPPTYGLVPDNKVHLPKRSQLNAIRRPHSADFLEYEVKHRSNDNFNKVNVQQPRPKSSLDISRIASDNDYYSQENYAENMRKSALILQQLPTHYHVHRSKPLVMINGQKIYGKTYYATEPHHSVRNMQSYGREPERVMSEDSLDMDSNSGPYAKSPVCQNFPENPRTPLIVKDDQFRRSASARLLKNSAMPERPLYHEEHLIINKEGERKREESMKRLLEWKQRMLQSPLNRKMSSNLTVSSNMTDREYFLRPTTMTSNYEYLSSPDERRSLTALSQFSSCSSDDEENDLNRSKKKKVVRSKHLQAGRTKGSHLDKSMLTYSPALNYSTIPSTFNTPLSSDKRSLIQSFTKDNSTHSNSNASDTSNNNYIAENETQLTVTDDLITSNTNSILKEIENPVENRDYEDLIVSTSKLVTNNTVKNSFEEIYLTMTPKQSLLSSSNAQQLQIESSSDCEENAYMEMTKGLGICILDQNEISTEDNSLSNNVIQYEMVGFGENKIEPVYMELNNSSTNDTLMLCNLTYKSDENEKLDLSDVLVNSKNETNRSIKSDSSDADDEASKDLNSLDAPYHPRFSLSDTFRPASYYLNTSRILTKFHDSSDSELVSPPFIPATPFIDEINNTSFYENDKHNESTFSKFSKVKSANNLSELDDSYYLSSNALKDKDESFMNNSPRLCSNIDSDTELRSNKSLDREYMLKRRPVSEEFCDVFECFGNHINNNNTNLDQFLRDLELNNSSVTTDNDSVCRMFNDNKLLNEFIPEHDYEDLHLLQNTANDNLKQNLQYFTSVENTSNIKFPPDSDYDDDNDNNQNKTDDKYKKFRFPAPYYYSDLPNKIGTGSVFLTLDTNKKNANSEQEIKHARSVSLDFLNTENKKQKFDALNNKTNSFENLVENVLGEYKTMYEISSTNDGDTNCILQNVSKEGNQWEEDLTWRESLQNACHRHTRSLNDLDNICTSTKSETKTNSTQIKPKLRRDVIYVNDNVLMHHGKWRQMTGEHEYSDSTQEQESTDSNTNEVWNITSTMNLPSSSSNSKLIENESPSKLNKTNFSIDRETLRQWDLLSSATSDTGDLIRMVDVNVEQGVSKQIIAQACDQTQFHAHNPESGSVSLTACDTIVPRTLADRMWSPNPQLLQQTRSPTINISRPNENDYIQSNHHIPSINQNLIDQQTNLIKQGWRWTDKINMSAGELLSRTHEELVLLLIQLRRQSTNTCRAIEMCYTEIDNIQAHLHEMNSVKRLECLQKIEQLRQHLLELEKQYEKGKPLVNLVDNMVKLGSLYRNPNDYNHVPNVRDRLEFNQQIQEQRLLAEEKRNWNRLSPNHIQLQTKVQQLYQLDRLLQEESDTLQGLQHNKEKIERALSELRHRLKAGHKGLNEIEQARKQRVLLENELSRVHFLLAQNSKKLEETVAGNARLEQELLVLRQKLQLSKQQRGSLQYSNAGDSLPCASSTSALLEAELYRVQALVGDLQRQRQELSLQVRQLTDRSRTLSQQIQPSCLTTCLPNESQTNNKQVTTYWRETDLDTMHSFDHGTDWKSQNKFRNLQQTNINRQQQQQQQQQYQQISLIQDYTSSDESQQQILELMPQERPEIKTVRIVKRESERRQRDREKTGNVQQKYDTVVEENDIQNTKNDINSISIQSNLEILSDYSGIDEEPRNSVKDSDDYLGFDESPTFKSEAACQIITEISDGASSQQSSNTLKNSARRIVPKEKRRHYTAPNNNFTLKNLSSSQTNGTFKNLNSYSRRARDDLDMERALRQRTDTPDVVRSTLSGKETKYNENTIDNLLGTPNKISIPERYIPEQLPQLSAEEQQQRLQKVESIKKMLSDTTILNSVPASVTTENSGTEKVANTGLKTACKINEEKRQREHLLELNQILAKQVMEMSKIVAVRALANLPLEPENDSEDEDDLSPVTPLPLYQQRHCYYT